MEFYYRLRLEKFNIIEESMGGGGQKLAVPKKPLEKSASESR